MATAETPDKQQRTMASLAWLSFAVSTALILMLIDWQDTGVAKPLWMFVLPTAIGIAGGIAGHRAHKELLGISAALFGLLAVPITMVAITVVYGP